MDRARRRQTTGLFASAALPILWRAIQRKGWSHAQFARAIELKSAARLLYGDRSAGRSTAVRINQLFPEVRLSLWDDPIPKGWKPHRDQTGKAA